MLVIRDMQYTSIVYMYSTSIVYMYSTSIVYMYSTSIVYMYSISIVYMYYVIILLLVINIEIHFFVVFILCVSTNIGIGIPIGEKEI